MAKARTLEDRLAALNELRGDPTSSLAIKELRSALGNKSNFLVEKAAGIAGGSEIRELEPHLVDAFDRFMNYPVKTDPRCRAKTAIAEALYRMDCQEEELFLEGIHHVQMEPVYGGEADSAVELRAVCALGLVRMNYRGSMTELAHLLADSEAGARAGAARALGYSERDDAIPLLRFKALTGDREPQVLTECLIALLKIAPEPSLPFVSEFLGRPDHEVCEAAAMALGESRLKEAFEVLRSWWQTTPHADLRRCALLAIAMLRQDRATDFLLELIARDRADVAREAIEILGMYRHDERLRRRVEDAVGSRDDAGLARAVAAAFDESR